MPFSTSLFIFAFLPVTLLGYYLFPKKVRNFFLLCMSFVFYFVGGKEYLFLLLFSIIFNYVVGILLETLERKSLLRGLIFVLGILGNLFPLFYFKYFDFAVSNVNYLFKLSISQKNLLLPLGISFYTFKALSYIIDVYRKRVAANRNIIHLALYIAIFSQVISGPIMPYIDLWDQIRERMTTSEDFVYGIRRFTYGLAKKVLIADILGQTVDRIFTSAYSLQADLPTVWLGAVLYTLQIYFDFAGYSDMAVGLGKMFGFTFMENFNYPYISKSISEFWRRWHISLSSWFRDYLYIPLGGNREGNVYFNLFVVFLVTGIWHGASWTFIIWGLWHGLFVLIERAVRGKKWYLKIPSAVKVIFTFLIVTMGWTLFRITNMTDAINYFKLMFGVLKASSPEFTYVFYLNSQIIFTLIIGLILSTPLIKKIAELFQEKAAFKTARVVFTSTLLVLGIIFAVSSVYSPFIYFQF